MDVEEIKRLKVARAKCDTSLMFFTRFFFKTLKNQKFIINWHHDKICNSLEKVANYETLFLNINIPPRHSKTELVVNFIAQNLGKNPSSNYLYITASDDLRSETSVKIRDIITSPEYQYMYGIKLKRDQNAKNLWRTEQGGGLKTATISGQITGFGAGQMIEHNKELLDFIREFEGCIVMDDINKIADAEALNATNKKVNIRIFDTVFSRKNSADTPLVNIQQRAGLEDATYELMKFYEGKDKVENLVLPVIIKGEPLWEWKHSLKDIKELEVHPKTANTFRTQYMQDPQPLEAELAFPKSQLKTYRDLPTEIIIEEGEEKEVLQGWIFSFADTADEGKDNFAMPIIQIVPPNVYMVDAIFDQENLTIQEGQVQGKVKEHKIRKIVVETNNAGAYFQRRIRALMPHLEYYGQWSKTNKMSRILSYAGIIKQFFYFPENPNPAVDLFMKEVCKLKKTSTKEDDAPDSLAGVAKHLEEHYNMFQ